MRSGYICGVVSLLFIVSVVSRMGNGADVVNRSHCAAIGFELQKRAALKAVDIAGIRARLGKGISKADAGRLTQWDIYIDGLDRLGSGLVENFEDPQPPSAYDHWWSQQQNTRDLTAAGEACTDQRLAK